MLSFPGLQPHQEHAWYAFLCQLAVIALDRGGHDDLPTDQDSWTNLILTTTEGEEEPWCLIVPDLDRPAFLQPPVPEGKLDAFRSSYAEPDAMDVLVTSKNHDVKTACVENPRPDHWMFALVSLQTMEGYSGRGHYEIARMNRGYGSRSCVAFVPSLDWGARFRRDVPILLAERSTLANQYGYPEKDGLALLWLKGWDGTESLGLEQLDPYFVEVCRRVRLVRDEESLIARAASTDTRRIEAREMKGNVGDPWTPTHRKDGKALSVSGAGFHYRLARKLLFEGDYELGIAGRLRDEDPREMYFFATALSRGQGQTQGLHRRVVPIPHQVRLRLGRAEDRDLLAERAATWVDRASDVRTVLHVALCALLQGELRDLDLRDERSGPWLERLDAAVDSIFFDRLWVHLDEEASDASLLWTEEVLSLAERELDDAIAAAPVPCGREYRATAAAERSFRRSRWRLLGGSSGSSRDEGQQAREAPA